VDALEWEHFLVASSPGEYAQAVLHILEDPAERRRLSAAGRARMLSHHAWGSSMRRLDVIIERCLAMRDRSPFPPAPVEEARTGVREPA
jgi:glycosyltransferase involved in cell wall biosynthesis